METPEKKEASKDQKRDRRLTSLKKKKKTRIKSKSALSTVVSVLLSIPVVFNNIQHPPRRRREEWLALRALNSRAGWLPAAQVILCKTE